MCPVILENCELAPQSPRTKQTPRSIADAFKAIGRPFLRNFIICREFFGDSKNISFNRNLMFDFEKIAEKVRAHKSGNLPKVRNLAAEGAQRLALVHAFQSL